MGIKELINNEITQEDLLNFYNANITNLRLPKYINGFVFNYKNISNIIINKNLSEKRKKETIMHELAHIELNHLYHIDKYLEFNFIKYEDEVDKYLKEEMWKF